jgi:hypothetical protein
MMTGIFLSALQEGSQYFRISLNLLRRKNLIKVFGLSFNERKPNWI